MPTRDEIKDFSILVEKIALDEGIGLMDAICYHCEATGLEIEVAATLISSALKAKIKEYKRATKRTSTKGQVTNENINRFIKQLR